jgi:K+-transporting ATPase KdpF subunit
MDIIYLALAGLAADCGARQGLRTAAASGGTTMSAWHWMAGALAGGLFVYLVAVLLRPEDFS